jgi:alpha-1,3-rhamnosyltransferase
VENKGASIMSAKISVIIPSYNHEPYIAQAIESVIAQTFLDIELLIIDDCSTDNTVKVIEELKGRCKKRFSRFVFVKKEQNLGLIDSMKKLVKISQGEFIFPGASDDVLKPNALEDLYNFIKDKRDYGVVVGDNEIIDEKGATVYWDKKRKNSYNKNSFHYKTFGDFLQKNRIDVNFFSEDFGSYESLLKGNYIPNGSLRRSAPFKSYVKDIKNDFMEDWYIMLQFSKEYKFKYIEKILYSYRWHETNTIKSILKMMIISINVVKNEKSYCLNNNLSKLYWQKRLIDFIVFCRYIFFLMHSNSKKILLITIHKINNFLQFK